MTRIWITGTVLLAILFINEAESRSGCANFGHSCYGGIGKRTNELELNEESVPINVQDAEYSIYPLKASRSQSSSTNVPRQFRFSRFSPGQYDEANNYVQDWIANYLRSKLRDEKLINNEGNERK